MPYRHTQIGWIVIAVVAVSVLVAAPPLNTLGLTVVPMLFLVVGLVVLVTFATLTVTVDDEAVEARFGIGLVRRRVPLSEIRAHRMVRNPWYYGWGIRVIPGGRLYNVSGLSAVELILADNSRVRVGTDEPSALVAALGSKVGPPSTTPSEVGPSQPRFLSEGVVLLVVLGPVLFVLGMLIYSGLQPPVVTVLPDLLSVRSGIHGDEIAIADIVDVSLEKAVPAVRRRTNGFALGATLRGRFELDAFGDARLFLRTDRPPFVKVRTSGKVMFVGLDDPARTRRLYAELSERLKAK